MIVCQFCNSRFHSQKSFILHSKKHEHEKQFILKCDFCPRQYNSVRQFQRHCHWHELKRKRDQSASNEAESSPSPDANEEQELFKESIGDGPSHRAPSFLERNLENTVYKSNNVDVADFISSLRAQSVPQKVCQQIVSKMKDFGTQLVHEYEQRGGEDPTSVVSASTLPSMQTLANVDTNHKLMTYARNEQGYISPTACGESSGGEGPQMVRPSEQLKRILQGETYSPKSQLGRIELVQP